jgi:hypothetical protein
MKAWKLTSLISAVLALNVGLAAISHATQVFNYAVCVDNSSCLDCIMGGLSPHSACTTAPDSYMCRLYKGTMAQTFMKVCTKTLTFSDTCSHTVTITPVKTCYSMSYWECGCAQQPAGTPPPPAVCPMLLGGTPCTCNPSIPQGPVTYTLWQECT